MIRLIQALLAVILVTALVAGGTALYLSTIDADEYRETLERQLSRSAGRKVRIGQLARVAGVLKPRFELESIAILNDPPNESDPIGTIDRAKFKFELLPLLRGIVRIDGIVLEGVRIFLVSDADGNLNWTPHLTDVESVDTVGGIAVELEGVDLADAEVSHHDVVTGVTVHSRIETLHLDIDEDRGEADFEVVGRIGEGDFDLSVRIEPVSRDIPGGTSSVKIRGGFETLVVEADGTVVDLFELTGIDLAISAQKPKIPNSPAWAGALGLEKLMGTARMRDRADGLNIESIDVRVVGEDHDFRVKGDLRDIVGRPQGDLSLVATLDSLKAFAPSLPAELSRIGSVHGNAAFHLDDGKIHADQIEIHAGVEGRSRLDASGSIEDVLGLREFHGRLKIRADDLRDLAPTLDERWSIGGVRGGAAIEGAGTIVRLEDVEIEAGDKDSFWVAVGGRVRLSAGNFDADATAVFHASRTTELEPWLDREVPELGPVNGSVVIHGSNWDIDRFQIRAGREDGVYLSIDGGSHRFPIKELNDVTVSLTAPDLATLNEVFDTNFAAVGPIEISGRVSAGSQRWALHRMAARFGESKFTGSIVRQIDPAGRPRWTGDIWSQHVRLADVAIAPEIEHPERESPWWSAPIPVEFIRANDGEIVVRIDEISGVGDFLLRDSLLRASLEEGVLRIKPIESQSPLAVVTLDASLDARQSGAPAFDVRALASGIDLARLAEQFTTNRLVAGNALLIVDLKGRGTTAQELLAGASGDVSIALRQGHLASKWANALEADLLRAWKLEKSRPNLTPIDCFVADFEFRNGIAKPRALLLDDDQLLIIGTGQIDFDRYKYDLLLTPKPKSSRLFRVALPIRLTGPLDAPEIAVRRTKMATDATTGTAKSLIAPGIGLLRPFVGLGVQERDPCAEAVAPFLDSAQSG